MLAPVPASVLRDELVRKIAGALGVPEARLVTLLGQEQPAAVCHAISDSPAVLVVSVCAARPSVLARGPQAERSFLAMCVAAPDLGAEMLARIDPDALLMEDALRRAARFLNEHLPGALPEPPATTPS